MSSRFSITNCQHSYALTADKLFSQFQLSEAECYLLPKLERSPLSVRLYLAEQLAEIEVVANMIISGATQSQISRRINHWQLLAMIVATRNLGNQFEPSPSIQEFGLALGTWNPNLSLEAIARKEQPMIDESAVGEFMETFQKRLTSRQYRQKIRDRRRQSQRMQTLYNQYVWTLSSFTRPIVVMLELSYEKACFDSSDAKIWQADLNHFFQNRRHNRLFDGTLGYVAQVSFSQALGFHWQLILWVDGNQRLGVYHVALANDFGNYWLNQITKGRGTFRQLNKPALNILNKAEKPGQKKYPERHAGYGVLEPTNFNAWQQLTKDLVNGYCTRSEWIRLALPEGFRDIRKGRPIASFTQSIRAATIS